MILYLNRFELIVDDMFKQLDAFVTDLVHGTPFEYWLLKRESQIVTFLLTLILCCLIWLIVLVYSSHRLSKRVAAKTYSPANVDIDDQPVNDAPIMKKLAPPGHRPTNAKLNMPPCHVARGFAEPTSLSPPDRPSPVANLPQNRTPSGEVAAGMVDREFRSEEDELPPTIPPQGRNVSGLAKDASVSNGTLRERGFMDEGGSPTRKYAARKWLKELMGKGRK
jgi:hypothetical protein